jgi:hypothetical protein
MFWLAFGTAAAVIGLALMTIGVSRLPSGANLLASPSFDGGLGLLALGGLLLLWALALYLMRRRAEAHASSASQAARTDGSDSKDIEAIKGYFAERNKLIDLWGRQERERRRGKK